MRLRVLRPTVAAALTCLALALALAAAAHATPSTAWLRYPDTALPVGTPFTVSTAGGTRVDVTVQTGGTKGVDGGAFDTLGVAATGLAYDSLRVIGVFNGGGFSTVPTSITFANIRSVLAHHRDVVRRRPCGDMERGRSAFRVQQQQRLRHRLESACGLVHDQFQRG